MVIVKASKSSEAGVMPDERMLTEMGNYNEELVKAGVMLAGEGLHPSSRAPGSASTAGPVRSSTGRSPTPRSSSPASGSSRPSRWRKCVEWVKRAPLDGGAEIEIRQVAEAEDFGEAYTDEVREQEDRLRAEIERQHAS